MYVLHHANVIDRGPKKLIGDGVTHFRRTESHESVNPRRGAALDAAEPAGRKRVLDCGFTGGSGSDSAARRRPNSQPGRPRYRALRGLTVKRSNLSGAVRYPA